MNTKTTAFAVFAGGCFWCTEAVFQRLNGVIEVIPGYTGGTIKNPAYREVCMGITGHAEAVKIIYDPAVISYETLLKVFFATHDPTTLNRQGNDVGTQYRSGIYYADELQRTTAEQYMKTLERQHIFDDGIVTEVTPLAVFYEAEEDHKDYYNLHRTQPYCQLLIHPKLKKLKTQYSHMLKTL